MNYRTILFLLCLYLFSCTNDPKEITIIDIDPIEKEVLTQQKLGIIVANPMGTYFTDDLYLVQNQNSDSVFIAIDAKNTDRYIMFGLKGRGPNEFSANILFGRNKSNKAIDFKGFNSVDRRFYELKDFNWSQDGFSYLITPYSEPLTYLSNIFQCHAFLDDSESMVFTDDVSLKLGIMDTKTGDITNSLPFSKTEKLILDSYNDSYKVGAISSFVNYSPSNKKIVYTSNNLGYIELYNTKLESLKKISINGEVKNKLEAHLKLVNGGDPIFYFIDLIASDSYIYLLYFNNTFGAVGQGETLNSNILVFDYDLNLKKIYDMNGLLYQFVVNEEKKEFIGIDIDAYGATEVVKYPFDAITN